MSKTTATSPIYVRDRYTIKCANESSLATIDSPFQLGPLDHIVFRLVPVDCIFVYQHYASYVDAPTSAQLIPLDRLKQAVSRLLDYYPQVTGRFNCNEHTQASEIGNLGAGVELLEAYCNAPLESYIPGDRKSKRILITDLPSSGRNLLPVYDRSPETVGEKPLLEIMHTRFGCGSVALGVRMSHVIADANGFFQLMRDLAALYRKLPAVPSNELDLGQIHLDEPPNLVSYLRNHTFKNEEDKNLALEYIPRAFHLKDDEAGPAIAGLVGESPRDAGNDERKQDRLNRMKTSPVVGRILSFSSQQLAEIKELATPPDKSGWVSTFEALSAYLLQQIYLARAKAFQSMGASASDMETYINPGFFSNMDLRGPGRLELPPRYFPNAVYPPFTQFTHALIADSEPWQVAEAVHRLFRSVDAERMKKTARWIAAQPDKSRIQSKYAFGDGSFTVSSWSKHNMYQGLEFDVLGNGQPLPSSLVSPPVVAADGLGMLLSAPLSGVSDAQSTVISAEKGSQALEVIVTLYEPVWSCLDEVLSKYYAT